MTANLHESLQPLVIPNVLRSEKPDVPAQISVTFIPMQESRVAVVSEFMTGLLMHFIVQTTNGETAEELGRNSLQLYHLKSCIETEEVLMAILKRYAPEDLDRIKEIGIKSVYEVNRRGDAKIEWGVVIGERRLVEVISPDMILK